MTVSELRRKHLLDVRPDRLDIRDREYRPPLVSLPPEHPERSIAAKLLPRYHAHGMVLDQGAEGACTGFGLAAVINYLLWRRENLRADDTVVPKGRRSPQVSERMLYHLARIYDEWPGEDYDGSSCRGAMKGWHRHGVCGSELWPYRNKKKRVEFIPPRDGWIQDAATRTLGAYYRINKGSIVDMQAAIHEVGAIYVSADVHSGWDLPAGSGGALPTIEPLAERSGGHAFAIVGYNLDGFIVQNSWGPDWGLGGFAVLTYEDWVRNGMDAWVAVLGAPVKIPAGVRVVARSRFNLGEVASGRAGGFLDAVFGRKEPAPYEQPEVAPWDAATAYHHAVVLANDGRPINSFVEVENAAAAVRQVAFDAPLEWLRPRPKKERRLAIYAHGGLNAEEDSIRRIRALAPYFKANGIYPIFLTWRTGFLESLIHQVEDALRGMLSLGPAASLKDAIEAIKGFFVEKKDRTVELICEQMLVKTIWTQMKQNAAAAANEGAGGRLLVEQLGRLRGRLPGLEIHLVGHSAGSIILGHLLGLFPESGLGARTLRLYAPACTTAFALQSFLPAVQNGVVSAPDFHLELLSDERERADSVGPYGKSLLYLVCRALEEAHKTPLLGMELAWMPEGSSDMEWSAGARDIIRQWRAFAKTGVQKIVHTKDRAQVSDGVELIPLAHGSFDNDVEVVTRTLRTILGGEVLEFRVERLHGF